MAMSVLICDSPRIACWYASALSNRSIGPAKSRASARTERIVTKSVLFQALKYVSTTVRASVAIRLTPPNQVPRLLRLATVEGHVREHTPVVHAFNSPDNSPGSRDPAV